MAKDPYKYFRVESRELIEKLTRGTLDLENGAGGKNLIPSLLRFAHTLKGASRVVKQPAIAEAAHAVEEILSPYRDDKCAVPKECTSEMLQLLDQITVKVAGLERPVELGLPATAKPVTEEPLETVRVEVEEVEALLSKLSEVSVQLAAIQREMEKVKQAKQLAGSIVFCPPRRFFLRWPEQYGMPRLSWAKKCGCIPRVATFASMPMFWYSCMRRCCIWCVTRWRTESKRQKHARQQARRCAVVST